MMPMAPSVKQHQQEMGKDQPGYRDEETIFNSKFGETAYKSFASKYPQLMDYVVTFKVIESDTENGRGLGAFILRYGDDVLYVPTVLGEGGIKSCEMLYNKTEDTFSPLIQGTVRDVVNTNKLSEPKALQKEPKTDSTREMFQGMFRPPSSTHPVLASSPSVDQLPNSAKEKISSYLQNNPELLAKYAQHGSVSSLAERLAPVQEKTADVEDQGIPDVIGLDTLTKEAAQKLSQEEKQRVIEDGFLVKKAEVSDYLPGDDLVSSIITEYNISQKDLKDTYGTGKFIVFDPSSGELRFLPALITPSEILYKYDDEVRATRCSNDVLVADFEEFISEYDLKRFGASPVTNPRFGGGDVIFFYPTKSANCYKASTFCAMNIAWHVMDEDVKVYDLNDPTTGVYFTRDVEHGKVGSVMPYESYYISSDARGGTKAIESFEELFKLINGIGITIRMFHDGAGVTIKDSMNKVAALPNSNTKIAEYLSETYDLGQDGIRDLINSKEVFVFNKEASMFAGEAQQQIGSETVHKPSPYPEIIDDTVDIGDDELAETGMIASVADQEEAQPLLIDMLPRFEQSNTDLGRTILMMNYEEESFKDFYGSEKYNTMLNKCRRVFTSIGEIIIDLRKYINMQDETSQ